MDYRPIGYGNGISPIFSYGINLAASWKGFDISMDFTGSAKSTYVPNYENKLPFHDGGNSPQYILEDCWHLADIWDANSELIPGKYPTPLIGNSSHSNYWASDFWITNVRYVKLKNFEFGYTLPKSLLKKIFVSNCRVYIGGQNLFTITNVPTVDPEIIQDSNIVTPTMRMFNIGLNVKF
jgi:hypothetical protein